MGVKFLSTGLKLMGLSDSLLAEPSNPLLMTLMSMYSEMGDRIALQYGGSEAHNKMTAGATEGGGGSMKGSGELLTSIKRYYSNAFTDRVKQDAMNLFLGHFIPFQSKLSLWDLDSDYLLHNKLLRPHLPYCESVYFQLADRQITGAEDEADDSESNKFGILVEKVLLLEDGIGVDTNAVTAKTKIKGEVLNKYFIRSDASERTKKDAIERINKRKIELKEKSAVVTEAISEWWKLALHEFDSQMRWLSIPSKDKANKWAAFNHLYRPSKLTSFDSIFDNEELGRPTVIGSSKSASNATSSGYWNRKPKAGSISEDGPVASTSTISDGGRVSSPVLPHSTSSSSLYSPSYSSTALGGIPSHSSLYSYDNSLYNNMDYMSSQGSDLGSGYNDEGQSAAQSQATYGFQLGK
jgi:hypothetical protein